MINGLLCSFLRIYHRPEEQTPEPSNQFYVLFFFQTMSYVEPIAFKIAHHIVSVKGLGSPQPTRAPIIYFFQNEESFVQLDELDKITNT